MELIIENPRVTIPELAESLSITERAIEKQIRKLREENKLQRVGPAKGGHWKILL